MVVASSLPSPISRSCARNLNDALRQVWTPRDSYELSCSFPLTCLKSIKSGHQTLFVWTLMSLFAFSFRSPLHLQTLESLKRLAEKPGKKEHIKLHQWLLFLLKSDHCNTEILDHKDRNHLLLWIWALDLIWRSVGGTGTIQDTQWFWVVSGFSVLRRRAFRHKKILFLTNNRS